jgi:predicted nucleic-acid-binding protein
MIAVDTNIVVRYLTRDNPVESARARSLIDGNDIFVCTTVFLETEWVLRSVYGFAADLLANGLRSFAGLPRVTVEDPGRIAQALAWMERGLDFADALHMVAASGCEAFVTFDRRCVRASKRVGAPVIAA